MSAPGGGDDDIRDRISAAPPRPRVGERAEASAVRAQWLHVLAIVLITSALIGFVTGTRGEEEPYRREARPAPVHGGPLPLAPTYAAIRESPLGPGRERHASSIEAMGRAHPAVTDEVPRATTRRCAPSSRAAPRCAPTTERRRASRTPSRPTDRSSAWPAIGRASASASTWRRR
ncbi:MAG: hypothetical protein M5U28_16880 [Sandaracinaceae bacterium]|nr:hypothetical protein [Sandaracinaceae bacterium]